MKTQKPNRETLLQGQAGVYAVASQLCMLGHAPFFSAVDMGVDIYLENGVRLQVKTAHMSYPRCGRVTRPNFGVRGGTVTGNYLGGAYCFNLRRGKWNRTERKTQYLGSYSAVADFFVLWGIEENRFWVVPTSVKNHAIWFGRKDHPNNSHNASYTDALKKQRCAEYENRWDLLDVNSTVEQIVAEPTEVAVEKEN